MGDSKTKLLLTGQRIAVPGIYQSSCGCRTALTMMADNSLPQCLGCDEIVEWMLVQEVRYSARPSSSAHLKAVRPLDPASGDE